FSVPRCNSPMCGSTRSTTSPSSSSTRRNTPCAAGCCGPKLMVKLRSSVSAMESIRSNHRIRQCRLARLSRQPGIEFFPCHHEALVTALPDRIETVMGSYLEGHSQAVDRDALGVD